MINILDRQQGKIPIERYYFPCRCLVLHLFVSIVDRNDLNYVKDLLNPPRHFCGYTPQYRVYPTKVFDLNCSS